MNYYRKVGKKGSIFAILKMKIERLGYWPRSLSLSYLTCLWAGTTLKNANVFVYISAISTHMSLNYLLRTISNKCVKIYRNQFESQLPVALLRLGCTLLKLWCFLQILLFFKFCICVILLLYDCDYDTDTSWITF